MTEQLVNYNITDAAIGEMREKYLRLRIVDLNDRDGAKAVDAARRAVKAKRCEVERRRKELKADALEWGRKVDSEAKRIMEMLLPIEQHLEAEEARIANEKMRIKAEEEARAEAERQAEMERIMRRVQALALLGVYVGPEAAGSWSEMEYEEALEEAQRAQAEREAERKAEEQRLEQIRQEQEAERERIAEERRVFEEEKLRLAEEKKKQDELAVLDRAQAMLYDGVPVDVVIAKSKNELADREACRRVENPAAELPSVIEMINEFRDHEPEFLQDRPSEAPESAHERYQVSITGNTETIYCRDHEKLFAAIGQWIDEIAGEGDTLSVTVFNMTDAQYEDLVRSIDAKEDQ